MRAIFGRLLRVTGFVALASAAVTGVLEIGLWINAELNSDGKWSQQPNAEFHIPINMHGSVVYLSAHDEFLYYSSLVYAAALTFLLVWISSALFFAASQLLGDSQEDDDGSSRPGLFWKHD